MRPDSSATILPSFFAALWSQRNFVKLENFCAVLNLVWIFHQVCAPLCSYPKRWCYSKIIAVFVKRCAASESNSGSISFGHAHIWNGKTVSEKICCFSSCVMYCPPNLVGVRCRIPKTHLNHNPNPSLIPTSERLTYWYYTMRNFCWISNNRSGVASVSTDISRAVPIR